MIVEIDESQRQMIIMALAHLLVRRPGWNMALSEIAKKMDNLVLRESEDKLND